MLSRLTSISLLLCTSPFVVSSSAVEECVSSIGCGQHGSSLLQGKDLRSSLMLDVQGSTVQQSLVSADDFVTELAQRVIGHNIPLTTEERTALNTIEGFITRMLGEAVTKHAADQLTVKGAEGVMDQCNTDATSSLNGEVKVSQKSMDDARTNHTECRQQQKRHNETRDDECQIYNSYRQLDEDAEPPDCIDSEHLSVGYVQTSNEDVKQLMEACLVATKPWFDPLYKKYKNCKDGVIIIDLKKAECNINQTKFELAYCEYSDKLDDVCSTQSTCMSNGRANRAIVHAAIEVAEAARMGDWSAGKHIECLFGVFKADNKDKNTTFNTCHDKTYDTASLKIAYPDEPVPVPCITETSKPCYGTWVSTEYTTQLWHDKAPVAECIPCVAVAPTPAPGGSAGPLFSGALITAGGGSALQKTYTTPSGWVVSSNLRTWQFKNLFWLSNLIDGSKICDPSTCSDRYPRLNRVASSYWMAAGGLCTANSWLQLEMDKARYVDHVELEPTFRYDSHITHFRILADGQDVTPTDFDSVLAAYNTGTTWPDHHHPAGATCDGSLRVDIKSTVKRVRLVNLTSAGKQCGFGEIQLVG